MTFIGIGRTFSTEGDRQYETIGAFWDELSAEYGLEELRGLGYGWTEDTIEYVTGWKEGVIPGADRAVELPDEGWSAVTGRSERLERLYEEIWREGRLRYEIESFRQDGTCEILYLR